MVTREPLKIDLTLTPENASKRGLKWWQDVIYDPEAPAIAMKEFYEYDKLGYKLGSPANSNLSDFIDGGCGLYIPLSVFPKEEF